MRSIPTTIRTAALALCVAALAACASDGGGAAGGADDPNASAFSGWKEGEPVTGDVQVTWKNLDPRNPPATHALVNESSVLGQRLRSGRATSSEVRVIADAEMGRLLMALRDVGFDQVATDGVGLESLPDVAGRKGVVVVSRDGRSRGVLLATNMGGSQVPRVYLECKRLVLGVHAQVVGMDVKVGTGEADERIFSVPPPRLKRP